MLEETEKDIENFMITISEKEAAVQPKKYGC